MKMIYVDGEQVLFTEALWDIVRRGGVDEYSWRIMDDNLVSQGELSGVESGDIAIQIGADIRASGSIVWAGHASEQPNWLGLQLQAWYSLETDQHLISWPLGVFRCGAPALSYLDGGEVKATVGIFDRTSRLRERALRLDPFIIDGIPYIESVRAILDLLDLPHSIEDDATVPSVPRVWMPPTGYHSIVSDALSAAGFFSLYADGHGVMRSQKYQPPSARPRVWAFTDKAPSYDREFDITRDWYKIPNVVIVSTQGTADEEVKIGIAENWDDTDPLSIPNRGYFDEVIEGVEMESEAELQAYANAMLAERRGLAHNVDFDHIPLPIDINDRVTFGNDIYGVSDMSVVVRNVAIKCTPGELWSSTGLEVKS